MDQNKLTITMPDDWHCHLRDGAMLSETVPATARCFGRAIVMPNLTPPITNAEMASDYKQRIQDAAPANSSFEPLMTLYLTNDTTEEEIITASKSGVVAAKLYPAGATTNSSEAVSNIKQLYPVFESLAKHNMLLLVHGEVTASEVDIFDREKCFIDQHLSAIHSVFPELKIVFEHITTADAVDFVLESGKQMAATITPQHLLLNRNDLLAGGLRPHNYCLPVLKRSTHQQRLREVLSYGSRRFFLGTDSAPHMKHSKESDCGCAGCYSAWGAIELYAQVFDELNVLDKLEGFASIYGPEFYGLKRNQQKITLVKQDWQMPETINLDGSNEIVPFYAGQTLNWKVQDIT